MGDLERAVVRGDGCKWMGVDGLGWLARACKYLGLLERRGRHTSTDTGELMLQQRNWLFPPTTMTSCGEPRVAPALRGACPRPSQSSPRSPPRLKDGRFGLSLTWQGPILNKLGPRSANMALQAHFHTSGATGRVRKAECESIIYDHGQLWSREVRKSASEPRVNSGAARDLIDWCQDSLFLCCGAARPPDLLFLPRASTRYTKSSLCMCA